MTTVRADYDQITQYTHEELPWRFSFANLLEGEETVSSAVAHLVDLKSGMSYAAVIQTSATVASPYVTQWVRAPRVGRYRFSVVATTSAARKWEIPVVLEVPY